MANLFQSMAKRERIDSQVQGITDCPLVSIITINYNQAEVTHQFLASAEHLTYPNYEIIVVDNASTQPFQNSLGSTQYKHLRLIRSEVNLGFTGGNNLGIQEAQGDFFFIVNNDTELSPTLLEDLLKPFAENDQIGVTCPKIRFFDAPQRVQYAGYNPVNLYTGTATAIGFNQEDDGRFDKPHATYFAHGCAMLVSRNVVERVGRFAERFFLYYEELDWSQRIRDAGFLIYYNLRQPFYTKNQLRLGRTAHFVHII